jgi:hypothetical protein
MCNLYLMTKTRDELVGLFDLGRDTIQALEALELQRPCPADGLLVEAAGQRVTAS